jgi:hypothetical protein
MFILELLSKEWASQGISGRLILSDKLMIEKHAVEDGKSRVFLFPTRSTRKLGMER